MKKDKIAWKKQIDAGAASSVKKVYSIHMRVRMDEEKKDKVS